MPISSLRGPNVVFDFDEPDGAERRLILTGLPLGRPTKSIDRARFFQSLKAAGAVTYPADAEDFAIETTDGGCADFEFYPIEVEDPSAIRIRVVVLTRQLMTAICAAATEHGLIGFVGRTTLLVFAAGERMRLSIWERRAEGELDVLVDEIWPQA
jgi:hypothetical protein